jgi:hypothetical protein
MLPKMNCHREKWLTMKILELKKLSFCLLTAALFSTVPLMAQSAEKSEWVAHGQDEDKTATIYLSTKFVPMTGTFEVVPASPTDARDSLSGTFLVGQFRYVFNKPEIIVGNILADEILTTNILECKEGFYGTIKTIKKLKNKVVQELKLPDGEFYLSQASGTTLWRQLCELHARQQKAIVRKAR